MQKKRLRIAGTLAGIITVFIAVIFSGKEKPFTNIVYKERSSIHVVISSGHGSILNSVYQTKGKQSPTWPDSLKIYEGYSTKMIALNLAEKLMKNNIDVTYINSYNTDMPLSERVLKVNGLFKNDKRVVLIDIHHNAQATLNAGYSDFEGQKGFISSGYSARGIECFTSTGFTKSDIICNDFIIPQLEKDFTIRYGSEAKGKEANFYILKYTHCPAVLVEFLFMTTYEDCLLIADPEKRDVFTSRLTDALIDYNRSLKEKNNGY